MRSKGTKTMKKKGIVKVVEMVTRLVPETKRFFYCWSRLRGHNGKILYPSETYTTKAACRKTARATAKQLGVEFKEI